MSAVTPTVYDGGFARRLMPGDVEYLGEVIGALATVGAGSLTAALLAGFSIISRTGPVGAYADTTDTAANIVGYLTGQGNGNSPNPGATFRLRIINTVAFINTFTAGTGVTLSGVTAIAASSWRDYLITLTNTTPTSIAVASTTNTSVAVTGMTSEETALITVGQLVTGTGIAANTKVAAVKPGIGVTLDTAATATGSLVALTFSPTVSIAGIGGGLI